MIVSVHGPPGVGKSLTHLLAAKALYNKNPMVAEKCPGHHCAGYKVRHGVQDAHEKCTCRGGARVPDADHLSRYILLAGKMRGRKAQRELLRLGCMN